MPLPSIVAIMDAALEGGVPDWTKKTALKMMKELGWPYGDYGRTLTRWALEQGEGTAEAKEVVAKEAIRVMDLVTDPPGEPLFVFEEVTSANVCYS